MKKQLIYIIVLTLATAYSQTNNVIIQKSMKMIKTEPWTDSQIKLVVSASSGASIAKSQMAGAKARRIVYRIESKPVYGREEYSFLLIHDPLAQKTVFIDGDHDFYLTDKSGVRGFTIVPGGVLLWSSVYQEVAGTNDDDGAIASFEQKFDEKKLSDEWGNRLNKNRMTLDRAAPRWYFSKTPAAGSGLVVPQFENASSTNGILKVDLRNPATKIPASFWIDINNKKVIRSVVDGAEMNLDLGDSQRSYAVPMGK